MSGSSTSTVRFIKVSAEDLRPSFDGGVEIFSEVAGLITSALCSAMWSARREQASVEVVVLPETAVFFRLTFEPSLWLPKGLHLRRVDGFFVSMMPSGLISSGEFLSLDIEGGGEISRYVMKGRIAECSDLLVEPVRELREAFEVADLFAHLPFEPEEVDPVWICRPLDEIVGPCKAELDLLERVLAEEAFEVA